MPSTEKLLTADTDGIDYFRVPQAAQDINRYLPCGGTLLIQAVWMGSESDVFALLCQGANVNLEHRHSGFTALCYAAMNGSLHIMKLLYAYGAYTHIIVGNNLVTPLILAVQHGHQSVVKWLIKDGAISNYWDAFGLRAIDYARLNHDQSMIQLLTTQEIAVAAFFSLFDQAELDYEAIKATTVSCGYNERDIYGETLCHMAAKHNHVKLMQILMLNCADRLDWRSHNHKGETALDIAIQKQHVDIIRIIKQVIKQAKNSPAVCSQYVVDKSSKSKPFTCAKSVLWYISIWCASV